MCIKREKKQHMKGVGERKTYINNIEEKISTIYVYKCHKTSCTRTMYLRKKRKEKNT